MLKKICFVLIFALSFVQYTMSKEDYTWSSIIIDKEMYYYGDKILITLYTEDIIVLDVPYIKMEFYWRNGRENTPENEILVEINAPAGINFDIQQIVIELWLEGWDEKILKKLFGDQNSFKEYFYIRIYSNNELVFEKNDILIIGEK
jgi:hypothetical protein